jgi:denticleless
MMKTYCTLSTLFARELERLSRQEYDDLYRKKTHELLKTLWTSRRHSCEFVNDEYYPVPLFAVEFSRIAGGGQIMATCDEDGYLTLIDASKNSSFGKYESGCCSADFRRNTSENEVSLRINKRRCTSGERMLSFRVHENAIFSLCWLGLEDQCIATASGDQKVKIFDVNKHLILNTLVGHSGSVKAIKEKNLTDGKILASASRDGSVMIWDTRCHGTHNQETGSYVLRPVLILNDIHRREIDSPSKRQHVAKRLRYSLYPKKKSMKPNVPHGVTALAFAPFNETFFLYTSGAVDGAVKLWDLRRAGAVSLPAKPISKIYPGCQEGLTDRPHGISSLDVAADGSTLCVASTDSNIYLYKTGLLDRGSFTRLCGHRTSSFYIKACFSPEGNFVLSGSADSYAYIWDVKQLGWNSTKNNFPLLRLPAHNNEVTDVAWCMTDTTKLATVGDDCLLKLWQTRNSDEEPETVQDGQRVQAEFKPESLQQENFWTSNVQRTVNLEFPTSRTENSNTLLSYFHKPISRMCTASH